MRSYFFDFDGTLALLNEDRFLNNYFRSLGDFLGMNPEELAKRITLIIREITINADGLRSNYERFMESFTKKFGGNAKEWEKTFKKFYESPHFKRLSNHFLPNNRVIMYMRERKKEGCKIVLATHPVFPRMVIAERLSWIGLKEEDFDLITSMEDFHYCKPDPRYFLEICSKISESPENCAMVGDDDKMDGTCEDVGIKFIRVSSL